MHTWILHFVLNKHVSKLLLQHRQIMLGNFPYDLKIHAKIFVNRDITEAGNSLPFYTRMGNL